MLGILAAIWAVVVRDIACIGKERRKGQILGWGAAGGDLGRQKAGKGGWGSRGAAWARFGRRWGLLEAGFLDHC